MARVIPLFSKSWSDILSFNVTTLCMISIASLEEIVGIPASTICGVGSSVTMQASWSCQCENMRTRFSDGSPIAISYVRIGSLSREEIHLAQVQREARVSTWVHYMLQLIPYRSTGFAGGAGCALSRACSLLMALC